MSDKSPVDPFENTIFETLRVPRPGSEDGEIDPTLRIEEPGDDPTMILGGTESGDPGATATAGSKGVTGSTAGKATETFIPSATGATGDGHVGEAVPLERGNQIRQYRLDAQVGKGGQGVVWLGFDSLAERQVALKFLPAAMARDKRAMKEMREEASVLFDLTHERIVRLNTIEQAGGYAFLVMEYLGGPSVQQVLKKRVQDGQQGLTVAECLWLLDQIAPPLDYANEKGVTHRDIKPANIMLTAPVREQLGEEDVDAKICDFGIAFVTSTQMNELEGFVPIGTVPFMAPEVIDRKQPTPAADVYSLGATLYYLIKGRPPFAGADLVNQIRLDGVPPLDSGDANFDAAVHQALAKDPAERPKSARDLLFKASGGKMGGDSQKSALKAVLTTAAIIGTIAAAVIFFMKRFASLEAQFIDLEPGSRFNAPVEVAFTVEDTSVEEASAGVVGQDPSTYRSALRNSDGVFKISVPTPAEEGPFRIELRDAGSGKELGAVELFADHTLLADGSDVKTLKGPFDIAEPLELRFAFQEPVIVTTLDGDRIGELETGEGLGAMDISAFPAGHETSSERVTIKVADLAGNSITIPFSVPMYSHAALVEHFERTYPLPDRDWADHELDAFDQALTGWERSLLAEERLTQADRDDLRQGEPRGRLSDRLDARLGAMGETVLHIENGFGVAHQQAGGAIGIYTRTPSYALTGKVDNALSKYLTVNESASGDSRRVELEEEGYFSYPLELKLGQVRELTLKVPGTNATQSVSIQLDDQEPAVRALRIAGRLVDVNVPRPEIHVNEATVAIEATMSEKLFSVAAQDASFSEIDKDVWGADVQLIDGRNVLTLDPRDFAGNSGPKTVVVVLDRAGPELTSFTPLEEERLRGSAWEDLELRFDEDTSAIEDVVALFEGEQGVEQFPVESLVLADARVARGRLQVPDRDGRLTLRITAKDELGNAKQHERSWSVVFDDWGSFPQASKHSFELELEPAWALDHTEWTSWVEDPVRGRLPRCIRHVKSGLYLVYVPSGTFRLGEDGEPVGSALPFGPAREVTMSGFYIGWSEVSQKHNAAVAGEDVAAAPATPYLLSFDDAAGWCDSVSMKLPSEAQWEYAASGPENRLFPWGGAMRGTAVNARAADPLAQVPRQDDVASRPAGASWCYARNMAGNAYEWCRDRLDFGGEIGLVDPVGVAPGGQVAAVKRGGTTSSSSMDKILTHHRAEAVNMLAPEGFRPVFELPE